VATYAEAKGAALVDGRNFQFETALLAFGGSLAELREMRGFFQSWTSLAYAMSLLKKLRGIRKCMKESTGRCGSRKPVAKILRRE
jgi:hypothetical protein